MRDRMTGIFLLAMLSSPYAHAVLVDDNCVPQQEPLIQAVAFVQEEGYRPLSAEELAEQGGEPVPGSDESQYRKPTDRDDDCDRRKSYVDPEERGYRPLDYGTEESETADESAPPAFTPGAVQSGYPYGWPPPAYPGFSPMPYYPGPMGMPPGAMGNIWPGGGYPYNPYYSTPQFIPGYGIMPYSFGGSGPMPY